MSAQPRLVVSAPSSGHGKTAIAVGLLAAAAARGIPAAGFKVGPDHTDAAYLGLAAGRAGRNLDPRLVGAQRIAPLFAHGASGAQLSVIEGAMGLFDSLTGQPEIDGTAAVAATLRAPVVLVVDVAAMGHSLAALVHGFRMFDEMVHLGGVILNRVASPRHEQMLRTALDDIGMPVLGALRRGDLPNVLPARAHGPVPVAHRTVEAGRAVRRLGEAVAAGLDLERLMALAGSAPGLPGPVWTPADAVGGEVSDQRPVVALAGGPGALYTYVETAELLTAAGAEVMVVDPLRDESLPAGTRALIVGAGLPEGFAEELSVNRRLCAEVAQFAMDGWPVVAEGVALPWLGRDLDGRPMCGVFDASATTGEQTVAGYREATAPTTSSLAPAGARITGYKQHKAIVTPRAGVVPAWTWAGGNPEGFVWRQVHASQLGLHWAAAPEIAKRLVGAALAGPAPSAPVMQPPTSVPMTVLQQHQPAGNAASAQGVPAHQSPAHPASPHAAPAQQGPPHSTSAYQGPGSVQHAPNAGHPGSPTGPQGPNAGPQGAGHHAGHAGHNGGHAQQQAMPAAGHAHQQAPSVGNAPHQPMSAAGYAQPQAMPTAGHAQQQVMPTAGHPQQPMPTAGHGQSQAMPTAGHQPGMPAPYSQSPATDQLPVVVNQPAQQLSPAQAMPASPAPAPEGPPPVSLTDTVDMTAP
nr:cobyrinate a,c-diamide synthase [uncultured Actinoplanes sp.]